MPQNAVRNFWKPMKATEMDNEYFGTCKALTEFEREKKDLKDGYHSYNCYQKERRWRRNSK